MDNPMPNDGPDNEEMTLQQQLVAYLDGELDTQQNRRIEQLLANDPEARESLRELGHTWDLLDELDTASVDDNFTQTTLETVALKANRDSLSEKNTNAARRSRRPFVVLSLIVATVAGFMTVSYVLAQRNAKLAEDLPLLRNLDYYRQTDDVALLRALHKQGLFAAVDIAEQPSDPADAHEIAHRWEQFEQMTPRRQTDIRRLHEQLESAADSARLEQVMRQYVDWLATRPPQVRAGLVDLPRDQRVKAVARMVKKSTASGGKKPGGKGTGRHTPERQAMQGVLKWFSKYAARHEAEIRKAAAEEKLFIGKKRPGQPSRAGTTMLLMKLWQARPGKLPFSTNADLKQVLAAMPEKARKKIESKPPEKQWQTVGTWVKGAMNHRHGANKRTLTPMQQEERLNHFFEKTISKEQRRRLLELPSEEFDRELRKLYQQRPGHSKKPARKPGRKKPSGGGKKVPATRPLTRP
jgi:anti-sigma factor RsiW